MFTFVQTNHITHVMEFVSVMEWNAIIKIKYMKKIITIIVIILFILTIIVWDRGYEVWLKFYLTMLGIVCIGGIWLSNQPPNDGSGGLV